MREAAAEKSGLRRALIARRKQMDAGMRSLHSRRIAGRLYASPCWKRARTIFCYAGTGWEVETEEIIRMALLQGRRVGVPLCRGGGIMEAHEIPSWETLVPGAFQIPEPGCGTPVLPPEAFDLAIVPAVAFDREGYRLGRGGGYYDRYLEQTNCVKAGLCFESFLLPSVPHEAHDVRMDRIFTEEGEYIWV